MSALRKGGLLVSVKGHPRPALAREPEKITLLDAYRAVEGNKPLLHQDIHTNPACGVGVNIQLVLRDFYLDIQKTAEQRMQEITLKDVLEQYHMKLEETLLQRLWQIDFQKLFHLGQKFFWTGNTEPPCGTILRTGKAYTPYFTNDWIGSLLRGHFHPTVGKAGYIIINNGAAKFEWSALNKSRRKPIWNLVLSVVCRQRTTAPEAGIFGQSERE